MTITDIEKEFLIQSNLIEDVGDEGIDDSIKAWEYVKKKDMITEIIILHVHKLLMQNLWPEIAGKFRDCNVFVGGRICPDWKKIKSFDWTCMLKQLNCSSDYIAKAQYNEEPPAKYYFKHYLAKDICLYHWIRAVHVDFETIYPFRDGNGRVGRILYNWQRLKYGLPVHVIKYDDRFEYYKWFD